MVYYLLQGWVYVPSRLVLLVLFEYGVQNVGLYKGVVFRASWGCMCVMSDSDPGLIKDEIRLCIMSDYELTDLGLLEHLMGL